MSNISQFSVNLNDNTGMDLDLNINTNLDTLETYSNIELINIDDFIVNETNILSPYVYFINDKLKRNYQYFIIDTMSNTSYSVASLAIKEKYGITKNNSHSLDNYMKETVIVTKLETNYLNITKIYFRPVVMVLKCRSNSQVNGTQEEVLIAGTGISEDMLAFKDNVWYSEYNNESGEYCDKITNINPDQTVKKTVITNGFVYEYDGELFYDKPVIKSDKFKIHEWCY